MVKGTNKKDYYKILEVSKTATKQEIKKAYKKLVLQSNLDKTVEEKFKELLDEAYSVLGRSDMRQKYDEMGYLNFSLEEVVREAVRKTKKTSCSSRASFRNTYDTDASVDQAIWNSEVRFMHALMSYPD